MSLFRYPHKIVFFIFAGPVRSIIEHHLPGSDIVLVHPQVDLFFGNDLPGDLYRKRKPGSSVPFPAILFCDTVPDMP